MAGTAGQLAALPPMSSHAGRFESNPATREAPWVKWTILILALGFFALFLLMHEQPPERQCNP